MGHRRIAIAGFQHETNTFAPFNAGRAEFEMADSWHGLLEGQKIIDGTRGMNLPIAGAILAAEELGGIDLLPILWCAAEPSGFVTDDAFDWISARIIEAVNDLMPLDGLYLDLHGAMVTQSHLDGEGELLKRLRRAFGNDFPIAVSLDLHANISAPFVDLATLVTICRTYPHLDMDDAGSRAMLELAKLIHGDHRCAAFKQVPFLVPLHAQYTGAEPCMSLYGLLDTLPDETAGEYAEIALGFTAADIPDCGPSILAYAASQDRADMLADELIDRFVACEGYFDTSLPDAATAVRRALATIGNGPAILADVQDNAGAGASSDTTGLLKAMISVGATNALLGVVCDAEVAAMAHELGVGAGFDAALGGRSGAAGDTPYDGSFTVKALSDGVIPYTGEMYGGSTAEIGPSCLLECRDNGADIQIVVSSLRTQCLDRALFTHFGVEPNDADLVGVKSTVHYRADFEPSSRVVMSIAAPGLFPCDLTKLDYKNLRGGVRIGPNGEPFKAL